MADGVRQWFLVEVTQGTDGPVPPYNSNPMQTPRPDESAPTSAPLFSGAAHAGMTGAGGGDSSFSPDSPAPQAELAPGSRIGRYRIIDVVGSGGMGVVYRAEQENPRRLVALKVVRPGLATDQALARLAYEAQILARLQHPGIAQVYEAGSTDAGAGVQPFFAMEYVAGRPLAEWIADGSVAIRARLELFVKICDAVQHAHAKGVIHRDLKPANILVVEEPSSESGRSRFEASGSAASGWLTGGVPKILDFGVARATDGDLGAHTMQTTVGQLIGTVPYMSPEQVTGDPREVDTRSDVYALGLILFEILTGRRPYNFGNKLLPEIVRIIREDEPQALSAANHALRGDLTIITRHALEKDKSRRYQSAHDLSADVRRFLADEPIVARPPSAWYQLSKFVRRNPVLAMTLGGLAATLVLGLLTVSILLLRTMVAEAEAKDRLHQAQVAEQKQAQEAEKARLEAATTEAVNAFFNQMLASVDPGIGNREITVREVLDRAAKEIEQAAPGRPLVEARLRDTIGRSYRGLGRLDEAAAQARTSLAIRMRELGEKEPETIEALNDYATVLQSQGKFEEAEPLFRRSFALHLEVIGPDEPATFSSENNLAELLIMKGNYGEAERHLRAALAGLRKAVGGDDIQTVDTMSNLAALLQYEGQLAEAEELARESLATRRRVFGNRHPGTLIAVNNLGTLLAVEEKLTEAEPLYYESLELSRVVLGEDHPDTIMSLSNVAGLLRDQDRSDEAEARYREVLEARRRVLGNDHADTIETLRNLGMTLLDVKAYVEAEELLRESADQARQALGSESADTAAAVQCLGLLLLRTGRAAEAEGLFCEAWDIAEHTLGADVWRTNQYRGLYGEALLEQGQFVEAEPHLAASYQALLNLVGTENPHTRRMCRALQRVYAALQRGDEARQFNCRAEP